MKKITYFYALLFAMLIGGGWTNYVWADIDWGKYASNPQANGSYYLCSYIKYSSEFYFFNTPSNLSSTYEYINATNPNGTNVTPSNPAILFTLGNSVTKSGNVYTINEISYQSGTRFLYPITKKTESWPKTTSACAWKMSPADTSTDYFTNPDNDPVFQLFFSPTWGSKVDSLFYAKAITSGSNKGKAGQLAKRKSLDTPSRKGPWVLITPEAYEDATASNQFYYTVAAQAYTNGAASTDGGTVGIVPKTYQKPDVTDWAAGDYTSSIAKSKKGFNGISALVTFYSKVSLTSEAYTFTGFTNGAGEALTASADIAANTYYEVDAVNHIYRVTIAVNGSEGSPTNFELRACFASASEPVVNVYNTNDEVTGYGTLAAALGASANGYRVELLANIENVSSTITINKDITLDFNGRSITGSATNLVTISGDVTFVDNSLGTPGGVTTTGATAVLVTGGSLTINDGKYTAATSYAVERTGGSVTINGGGFQGDTQDISGTVTLKGGFFVHNTGLTAANGYVISRTVPTGLRYDAAIYKYLVAEPASPNYAVCTADGKYFKTLEAAITYANNASHTMTIVLRENYLLPAGNYTIPAGDTLLIPYNAEQQQADGKGVQHVDTEAVPEGAYCTLTLASGVHLDVYGVLEVGGCQTTGGKNAVADKGIGRPGAPYYGLLHMKSGSSITMNSDTHLYAWGYVTGDRGNDGKYQCEIDVRRGAVVHEHFQLMDWKKIDAIVGITQLEGKYHILPVSQYHIQNVEVPARYRPGSRLLATSAINYENIKLVINDAGMVGVRYSEDVYDDAVFLLDDGDVSEDTWVCKYYDPSTDQQVYEINNSAHVGSLAMKVTIPGLKDVGEYISIPGFKDNALNVDSRGYHLPITNNFKMHLLSGNMHITQNTIMLPGSVIEIDKKSTMIIDAGQTLWFYDSDDWGAYVATTFNSSTSYGFGYATKVKYRPGGVPGNNVRDISSAAGLGDAKLIVHGTVDVEGSLRTTPGGSSITSTIEDAGTIKFSTSAPTKTTKIYQLDDLDNPLTPVATSCPSAKLKNENGDYVATAGTTANKSFCFIDFDGNGKGEWKSLTTSGCFVYDENDTWYAKPQDYVALANKNTSNADHTYSSATGNRTLINTDDCQWWEVEKVGDNLYHCTHPSNSLYYYWDGSQWTEKRCTVTWNDYDGTTWNTYSLKYGVQPKYLDDVPQREYDDYYTYDFAGWSPAITESTIVTGDITYTAQYKRTDRLYTITWKDEAGNTIETDYYKMGAIPSCYHEPDMANKEWNPAVSAVTGNATYTLQNKNNDGPFTIKFVNWNGKELQSKTVSKDETPQYTGTTPTKPALSDVRYSFIGWIPEIVPATANAVYTAKFDAEDASVKSLNIVGNKTISDTRNDVTDLYISKTGSLTITSSVTAQNFYLEASESTSGQLLSSGLTVTGNVYFDLALNTPARHWHAFGVPWAIGNLDNVKLVEVKNRDGEARTRTLTLGRDYDIIYYNGTKRAAQGPGAHCWEYVQFNGKTLKPGQGYMIAFTSEVGTVRFTKAAGADIIFSGSNSVTGGSGDDGGWNAIANPMAYHATLNAGPTVGYVHDGGEIGSDGYVPYTISGKRYIVGKAVYIQATATQPVVINPAGTAGDFVAAAPARRRAKATDKTYLSLEDYYRVSLADAAGKSGSVYVLSEEDKADQYVIGHDLSQFGMNATKPQLWINRYGTKLALNTTAPVDGAAEFPMSVYAPAAGEYTIALAAQPDDENAVYLTKDGEVIWNLSDGACTLTLAKGTTANYGLRIGEKKAPEVATDLSEAVVDAHGKTTKVLIDGKVFIIRENRVYSIDGQLVK